MITQGDRMVEYRKIDVLRGEIKHVECDDAEGDIFELCLPLDRILRKGVSVEIKCGFFNKSKVKYCVSSDEKKLENLFQLARGRSL